MSRGHDDASDGEDGPILSPDELDIANDDHVAEIEDGRYVVSPNEPIGDVPRNVTETSGSADSSGTPGDASEPDRPSKGDAADAGESAVTGDDISSRNRDSRPEAGAGSEPETAVTEPQVRAWLSDQFTATDSRYGFDVTATFDGSIEQRRMVSNDVVTIFESLVLWYAQQIDSTTPVEEVLGILLMEANVPVKYPTASLQRVLESTDLGPEDSIADLASAIEDDGFKI
jgi:hypothetical protein